MVKSFCTILTSVTLSLICPFSSIAETQETIPLSLGDQLEDLGLLYRNKTDPLVQEAWLLGRYHGQYVSTRGGKETVDEYETRRGRFGTQIRMLNNLTLHAQSITGTDFNPGYNGFTELWAQWEFHPALRLTVGQQKHRFTHDRNVSSRYLNYLERSMLTNMFGADYTPAVTLQGTVKDVSYYTGIFSNRTERDMGEAFTEHIAGHSFLGAAYYDLGRSLNTNSAFLHFSTVVSNADAEATNLNRFENGISSALVLTEDDRSLVAELVSSLGGSQGAGHGINVQPSIFLTDTLQLVGRYQLAFSDTKDSLTPQRRYERPSGITNGELYNAGYLGLDYYLAKHRIKIMQGVEYSNMDGEGMWTFGTMFRFYFGPHSGGAFPMNQMLKSDFWASD